LIESVLGDNATWRRKNLEPWQIAAIKWHRSHEDEIYLVGGEECRWARRWLASHADVATDIERRFIERSSARHHQDATLLWIRRGLSVLGVLLTVSVIINVVLLVWLIWAR
jgi:hypothetical protein